MKDHAVMALKEFRSIVTLYLATMGYILYGVNTNKGLRLPGIEVSNNSFSLIFAIIFCFYFIILIIKLKLLKNIILISKKSESNDLKDVIISIKYLPWVLSPFQSSKYGVLALRVIITSGIIYVYILSITHIIGDGFYFRIVGVINFFIFYLISYIAFLLNKTLKEINKIINDSGF